MATEEIEICKFDESGRYGRPDLTHLAFELDDLDKFAKHARQRSSAVYGPHSTGTGRIDSSTRRKATNRIDRAARRIVICNGYAPALAPITFIAYFRSMIVWRNCSAPLRSLLASVPTAWSQDPLTPPSRKTEWGFRFRPQSEGVTAKDNR